MQQQKKVKKVPQRKCIACGEHDNKKSLVRVVKNKEGLIFLDKTWKANGRGAYFCATRECFQKVCKSKMLDRAFKISVDKEIYETLKEEIFHDEK